MNKLLVVDDEPFSVAGVVEGIDWNSIGVSTVFGVTSVGEARNMVRKYEIDVILCDIEMAGENGLDFLKWLRGNGYSSKLIFLTAYPRFEYAQEAIGWGISDYLIKPVDFQLLKERVRVVLDKYLEEKKDAEKIKEYERMRQEPKSSETVVLEPSCENPAEEVKNVSAVIQSVKEYEQKCSTVISSGEPFDLMFTCGWLNNFTNNAGNNAFLPLNDLLEENAPEAMADVPEFMWDAVTINENILAMPAVQCYAVCDGFFLRADVAETLGVEGSSYEPGGKIYTMEEVEAIYDQIIETYGVIPDDCPGIPWMYVEAYNEMTHLAGYTTPGAVRDADVTTVINQFESEEFAEYCDAVYKWVQKGYVQPDLASYVTMTDQLIIDRKSEDHVTYRAGFVSPHVGNMAMADCGWEEEPVPIIVSEKHTSTGSALGSLTAVGINSQYPEKAVQLYNLAYSDPYVLNTMIYGLEGVNYNKVSDTEVEVISDSNYVTPLESYSIANQFNTWVQAGVYPADIWNQVKAFCEDTNVSDLMGFSFDTSSVKNQVANCSAIYEEYKYPLLCGAVDPEEVIPTMLSRMEEAGSAEIVAEAQRQVDEFLANK